MARFQDHFSAGAAAYAASRPRYPDALFAWLAEEVPGCGLAVDLAAGSGQATEGLARRFDRVVAAEASLAQLAAGGRMPGVSRLVSLAEELPLAPRSADLITVAQALHWLDHPRLWSELERVLVPRGVVAVWCYDLLRIAPEIDQRLGRFYRETVGPFWAPERRMVEEGYRGVPFPFDELAAPPFAMTTGWTLAEVGEYLGTWSATRGFRRATGRDPVPDLLRELEPWWGDPAARRRVDFPLSLRVGRAG
jgi:SAM-dependent methyltransferase